MCHEIKSSDPPWLKQIKEAHNKAWHDRQVKRWEIIIKCGMKLVWRLAAVGFTACFGLLGQFEKAAWIFLFMIMVNTFDLVDTFESILKELKKQ